MAASSGLRQGCSMACTLCPSKAAQSVQSPPQLGILCLTVRSAAGRKLPPPLSFRSRSAFAPRSLHSRYALAPLRLPAAPAGSSKLSPASAATARRTLFSTLPTFPSRLAGLVGLQRLAVQGRPNPPSRPERPTASCYLPARTRPPGTLALERFEKNTTKEPQRLRRRCGCSSLDNSLKIRTFVSAPRYLPATSELKSCNPYEDPGSLHPDQ